VTGIVRKAWVTRTLAGTAAASFLTAGLGSLATASGTSSPWYRDLRKPSIQPPAVVFPIVWTTLYTDIAVSSAFALDALEGRDTTDPGTDAAHRYRWALGVNLALNAGWSWTFFRWHRIGPAVVVAGALAASSLDLARRARQGSPGAAAALVPYAAWCGFATVLTTALWWRNR
jgi:benzodiazapine receptor